MLDRARFPRDKTCGGWITPEVLRLIQSVPDEYQAERVLQPISSFRTGCIGDDRAVTTEYPGTVSFGIRRREFDDFLLRRSGARLVLGESLQSIKPASDGWLVNETLRPRLLIGAGGHFCPVKRMLQWPEDSSASVVQAQETEFLMSPAQRQQCRVLPHQPELYFCDDLQGYGWCFRKRDYLNIGLGRVGEHHLQQHVAGFVDFLRRAERIGFELPERLKGHAYRLLDRRPGTVVQNRVLLIGDAAGLADAHSGEGILAAITSGLLAASTILDAASDFSAAGMSGYQRAIDSLVHHDLRASWFGAVPGKLRRGIAGKLLRNRWFTRHVILDRWFLHSDGPRYAPKIIGQRGNSDPAAGMTIPTARNTSEKESNNVCNMDHRG